MDILLDGDPDRLVNDVFIWVVKDKRTQMEGIFALTVGPLQMQCATSSIETAKKIGEKIKELPFSDKEFTLYRYKKIAPIETL